MSAPKMLRFFPGWEGVIFIGKERGDTIVRGIVEEDCEICFLPGCKGRERTACINMNKIADGDGALGIM